MIKFNTLSTNTLSGTLSDIIGAESPKQSSKQRIDALQKMVTTKLNDKPDRLIIYNPDAIGQWYYEKYKSTIFAPLEQYIDLKVNLITAFPPKTPVCFATMFTGANPDVHGITKYEKPVVKIDSIFDSWVRSGKKIAMISVKNQSIPRIFAERNIDYYLLPNDSEVIKTALDIIKEDKYDVIEIYNQEYDDVMHRSYPESVWSKRASEHYVESYIKIIDAVKQNFNNHNTLITFSPDHGTHRSWLFGLGQHGKYITKDMNISHFFTVIPKK